MLDPEKHLEVEEEEQKVEEAPEQKNVNFADDTKAAAESVHESSQEFIDVMTHLKELKARSLAIQTGLAPEGVSSDYDVQMLESIEQNMGQYWDEIMACLLDEVVEEEVLHHHRLDRIMANK